MKLFLTQIDPPSVAVRTCLQAKGFDCHHLAFRHVHWLDPAELPKLPNYAAVILTSKNAARWFLSQNFPKPWPPFALVGEATARLLTDEGATLLLKPAAYAKELAQKLSKCLRPEQPVLFLHGLRVSPDLPSGLKDHQLTQLVVYETVKNVPKMALSPAAGMVYFQAPSTVEDFVDVYGFRPKYVAVIGPSTKKRALQEGWSVDFQPSRPELTAFIQELPQSIHFKG